MTKMNMEPRDGTTDPPVGQKPGSGVDRTLIRNMLRLTPAERLQVLVASARNLAELLDKARRG